MTVVAGTKPHPIFLAGRWVESPDVLVVDNPADPSTPAGTTYNATEAQYEEAVEAAVAAFEVTRHAAGLRARPDPARDQRRGCSARREELGRLIALEAGKPIRDALVEVDRAVADLPARRRGGGADDRRGHPARPAAVVEGPDRDHPALPDRPDRGHQPVQLPAQPGRPQARRRRSPRATRSSSSRRPRTRSTMLAVAEIIEAAGVPAGSVSILPMTRELGRPDGRRPALQAADVHRLAVGRLADEGARRQEAGRARARRQRRRHRRQDRRPRLGGQALPGRGVRLCRPGLHQRPAHVHPRGHLGRVHGQVRRGRQGAQGRRPARPDDRRRADGRRDRRRPDPALGRRGGRARRQGPRSAARPTARSSRRRS